MDSNDRFWSDRSASAALNPSRPATNRKRGRPGTDPTNDWRNIISPPDKETRHAPKNLHSDKEKPHRAYTPSFSDGQTSKHSAGQTQQLPPPQAFGRQGTTTCQQTGTRLRATGHTCATRRAQKKSNGGTGAPGRKSTRRSHRRGRREAVFSPLKRKDFFNRLQHREMSHFRFVRSGHARHRSERSNSQATENAKCQPTLCRGKPGHSQQQSHAATATSRPCPELRHPQRYERELQGARSPPSGQHAIRTKSPCTQFISSKQPIPT